MEDQKIRKPKEITLKDMDGEEHKYILSRMPAIPGLEVATKFIPGILNAKDPGQYDIVQGAVYTMLEYVFVQTNNIKIPLKTRGLIDNHCADGEILGALIREQALYNSSFLAAGRELIYTGGWEKVLDHVVTLIITRYSQLSKGIDEQQDTN